ncbi:MAG: PA4642 family protein [Oleibacter sp.]|nr:PA4642 family protein [Thalassolituus sp.]
MQKKDKEKVFGGEWSEAQLRDFLTAESYDGSESDYIAIIRAYRHMLPETFADYIELFTSEGHNLDAKNSDGTTALETLNSHVQGQQYAAIIESARH